MRELNIEEQEELNQELAPTKAAKEIKQKARSEGLKNVKSTWKEKLLHGQYPLFIYLFICLFIYTLFKVDLHITL